MYLENHNTSWKGMKQASVVIVATILLTSIIWPASGTAPKETVDKTVVSSGGIQYKINLFERNLTVLVEAKNPTNRTAFAGFVIEVDGRRDYDRRLNLSKGEEFQDKIKIKESIDILASNHVVHFSTYGNSTSIEFTREIDYHNTSRFPKPQITDVRIANGTVDGNQSTVAYVTVANPSNQLFPMKLLVHTTETQGGLYGASTPEYTNHTIKVELLEEPGSTVAGEARLYVGSPSEREGALDQVEFVGHADGETEVYNRSYEPVTGPWAEDHYEYRNESVRDDAGSDDWPSHETVVTAVAGLLVVLSVVVTWRWR